jgi:hypothetical protein
MVPMVVMIGQRRADEMTADAASTTRVERAIGPSFGEPSVRSSARSAASASAETRPACSSPPSVAAAGVIRAPPTMARGPTTMPVSPKRRGVPFSCVPDACVSAPAVTTRSTNRDPLAGDSHAPSTTGSRRARIGREQRAQRAAVVGRQRDHRVEAAAQGAERHALDDRQAGDLAIAHRGRRQDDGRAAGNVVAHRASATIAATVVEGGTGKGRPPCAPES